MLIFDIWRENNKFASKIAIFRDRNSIFGRNMLCIILNFLSESCFNTWVRSFGDIANLRFFAFFGILPKLTWRHLCMPYASQTWYINSRRQDTTFCLILSTAIPHSLRATTKSYFPAKTEVVENDAYRQI